MSSGRQLYHACATGFVCLLLLAVILLGGRFLMPIAGIPASAALAAGTLIFEAIAILVIVLQIRDYCRIVREFSYDGIALRYSTLGSSRPRSRDLYQIADIRQGRVRAPSIGFAVVFRDGKKVYLDYSLPHAREVAERLRLDLSSPA